MGGSIGGVAVVGLIGAAVTEAEYSLLEADHFVRISSFLSEEFWRLLKCVLPSGLFSVVFYGPRV